MDSKEKEKNNNKIQLAGRVKKVLGGGVFHVELENSTLLPCHTSGKMKRFNVNILPGDKVDVEINPYDLTKGRIVKRIIETPTSPS